jgi:hypothetical protein
MQLILQATHGVVSGDPKFFRRAFGDTVSHFQDMLLRPHHFIFNRDWYEVYEGRAQYDQFTTEFRALRDTEKAELLELVADRDPSELRAQVAQLAHSRRVRAILKHYIPLTKHEEAAIWDRQKELKRQEDPSIDVPDDERVEDAGLTYDEPQPSARRNGARAKRAMVCA